MYTFSSALFVHGFNGTPATPAWFAWLVKTLSSKDMTVKVPQMPRPAHPNCEQWITALQEEASEFDFSTTLFIGHSLGGTALMRFLEKTDGKKAAAVILVASPLDEVGRPAIRSFFETPFDFEKLRSANRSWKLIYSKDDPYVPFSHGEELEHKLRGQLFPFDDKRHFEMPDFNEILNII